MLKSLGVVGQLVNHETFIYRQGGSFLYCYTLCELYDIMHAMWCFTTSTSPLDTLLTDVTRQALDMCGKFWTKTLKIASLGELFDHSTWKGELPTMVSLYSTPVQKLTPRVFLFHHQQWQFSPRISIPFHNCFAIEYQRGLRNFSRSLIVSGLTLCSLCSFCRKWFHCSIRAKVVECFNEVIFWRCFDKL